MAVEHELKTWPEPFRAVRACEKVHEYRRDDRDFQKGDHLILLEWDPETQKYTGERIRAEVTHITRGGQFGIPRDYCVMSIMGMSEEEIDEGRAKESLMRVLNRAEIDVAQSHLERLVRAKQCCEGEDAVTSAEAHGVLARLDALRSGAR